MATVMEVTTVPLLLLSFLSPSVVPVIKLYFAKVTIKFIEPLTVIMNEQFMIFTYLLKNRKTVNCRGDRGTVAQGAQ